MTIMCVYSKAYSHISQAVALTCDLCAARAPSFSKLSGRELTPRRASHAYRVTRVRTERSRDQSVIGELANAMRTPFLYLKDLFSWYNSRMI